MSRRKLKPSIRGCCRWANATAGETGRPSQQFTARIVPIPSFGTKRIEMEYQHPCQ